MSRGRRAVRQRALLGTGVVALAALGWVALPRVGARLPLFRLRQIELVGVHQLSPEAVIAALRLPERASVFTDTRLLADRVRGLDGVADASVGRLLPSTLRVRVTEVLATAFVAAGRNGRLEPVDARGRPLPFDPGRAPLDLPIAASGDSGLIAVLALVQSVDPTLFAQITGARTLGEEDVELELGTRDVLLRRDASTMDVTGVESVARDLEAKGRDYGELDGRFAGQVVVRRAAVPRRRARHRHRGRRP